MAVVYPGALRDHGRARACWPTRRCCGSISRGAIPGWLDGGEFEGIRWPLALVVAFVLAGAGVALPPLRPAAYNVLLVVAFFFALQGLAVVALLRAPPRGPAAPAGRRSWCSCS